MASPFSLFRKYQAALLVVFGIALMVAFVVLPAVIQMQQIGGGGGFSSDAVLTWTGGEVTRTDVDLMTRQRYLVLQFLSRLQEAAEQRQGGKEINRTRQEQMLRRLSNNSRSSVVQSMILAQKGRDMGMAVDDQAIRSFLHSVSDNTFTTDEELNAELTGVLASMDNPTTVSAMFNALREELLAQNVLMMGLGGIVTTPSEAWDYYNRVHRGVNAEFIPFTTEDFVTKVEEPSSREVDAYYEKYQNREPALNDPDPAFKIPKKVEFHYVVADFNKFFDEEKGKVTRSEIEEYYEENKENFRIPDPPSTVDEIDLDDPRSAPPRPPVVPEEESADESTDSEGDEEGAGGCDEESEDSEDGDAPDNAEPPASTEDETSAPEDGEDAVATDSDASESTGEEESDDPEPMPKYRPLEEVEDQIRNSIARPLAQDRVTSAIEKATEAIKAHSEKVLDFEAYQDGEDPGVFDGKALAGQLDLEHGSTGMIGQIEMFVAREKFDIVESSQGFQQQQRYFLDLGFNDSLLKYQPIETFLLQSQEEGPDKEKRFLAWKVDEEEARVPELDEIKEGVIQAWKTEKARELAKQAAQTLTEKLDGKQPLQEQVGTDHEVLTPETITFYSNPDFASFYLQAGQRPPTADIEGIEEGGSDDIKRAVIQMPVGDVRVVSDASKEKYYVVRIASDELDEVEAREDFMQDIVDAPGEGAPIPLQIVGQEDKLRMFSNWYEQVEEDYEVHRIDPGFFFNEGRGT